MFKEAYEVLQVAKSAIYESCITFVYVLRCEERTLTLTQAFAQPFGYVRGFIEKKIKK